MSVPDMGAAAAKTAQTAQPDGSFGAMLSGLDAVADPSAPDAGKSSDSQIEDVAFADAAALTAAMSNQMSWMAQLDAAKALPPQQDAATPPASAPQTANPAAPPPQAAADPNAPLPSAPQTGPQTAAPQAAAPQASVPQPATPPVSVSSDAPQTASLADSQADSATPAPAANGPAETPAEPAPATKLAAATPTHSKDDKPAHPAADAGADVQADVSALPQSSPLATQSLAVPTLPSPQTTPAPASNPAPEQDETLNVALAAAIQSQSRASGPDKTAADKTASDKNAPASDAKAGSNVKTTGTRQANAPASADASAAAKEPSAAPAKTAESPVEHAPKNDAAPLAANLAQASPAPAPAPVTDSPLPHAAPDLSTSAISNAPAAPSLDVSTPVKLSFATPLNAQAPSFDALALKIASRSADGENNFAIRLDPPELGRIEVNLNVNSDGHAQASLSADKPQTLELLQKDSSALERALKDAGLNLAGGMTFSLKGDGRSQDWRDAQNTPRSRNIQISGVDTASANAAITTSAALAARAYGLPVALLDIRV
jgi:hypothetical protein